MTSRWFSAWALAALPMLLSCSHPPKAPSFSDLRERFFRGFLRFNPVTCTYLGGDGAYPDLAVTLRSLKDYSEIGRRDEMALYQQIQKELSQIDPKSLSPADAVDARVMNAQITFLLHQTLHRRYYQRALDSYVVEPFRAVDWQMQQMTDRGGGNYGTEEEWTALIERVMKIPAYLEQALKNVREGISAGNFPDRRMVETDGIKASESNADYFKDRLPEQARAYLSGQPYRDRVVSALTPPARAAGLAYREFANHLSEIFLEGRAEGRMIFRPDFRADRFALGEE